MPSWVERSTTVVADSNATPLACSGCRARSDCLCPRQQTQCLDQSANRQRSVQSRPGIRANLGRSAHNTRHSRRVHSRATDELALAGSNRDRNRTCGIHSRSDQTNLGPSQTGTGPSIQSRWLLACRPRSKLVFPIRPRRNRVRLRARTFHRIPGPATVDRHRGNRNCRQPNARRSPLCVRLPCRRIPRLDPRRCCDLCNGEPEQFPSFHFHTPQPNSITLAKGISLRVVGKRLHPMEPSVEVLQHNNAENRSVSRTFAPSAPNQSSIKHAD